MLLRYRKYTALTMQNIPIVFVFANILLVGLLRIFLFWLSLLFLIFRWQLIDSINIKMTLILCDCNVIRILYHRNLINFLIGCNCVTAMTSWISKDIACSPNFDFFIVSTSGKERCLIFRDCKWSNRTIMFVKSSKQTTFWSKVFKRSSNLT